MLVSIASYLALGALMGWAYLLALDFNVRLYLGDRARWRAPAIHLLRMLVIAAGFTLCARQGAVALLSSLAGFLVIRAATVNRHGLAMERNA